MPTGKTVTNPSQASGDTISFAELPDGVVVIRVIGRGSFANSVEFKRLTDLFAERLSSACRFVLDLEQCVTMDSTFMGVLANVGLRQRRDTREAMTLVNVNEQNERLLHTLGLAHFLYVRTVGQDAHPATEAATDFRTAEAPKVSKTDRIVHMIEAHENLVESDSANAVRFESVLKYLNESLKKEQE